MSAGGRGRCGIVSHDTEVQYRILTKQFSEMTLGGTGLVWRLHRSQHEGGAHGSYGVVSRDTGDVSSYNQHYLVSHLDLMGHIGYIPTDGEFGMGAVLGI